MATPLSTAGGIPIAQLTDATGGLVASAGQLQYGQALLGGGTSAGWKELVNWRSTPDADVSDSNRPQALGAFPGTVLGGSLAVTYTFILRGLPADKLLALQALERYLPMDGVDRALVVNDGDGPWLRMARVIGRTVPQDKGFQVGPLECSVQFLCADPRRYGLIAQTASVALPVSSGGIVYPIVYGIDYGTAVPGTRRVTNNGSTSAPLQATFVGPLTNPRLTGRAEDGTTWNLGFNITLGAGESLVVDASTGTALLGGADRIGFLTNTSDPIEAALLQAGNTDLTFTASAGTGRVDVASRDARL